MRTGADVLGKQVVTFSDGKQIAKIHDLIFNHKQNMVLGFLVDEGGWFSSAKVLPLELVKSIGEDAIVIETATAIMSADDREEMKEVLANDNILKGTRLMTESGKLIGTLVDLSFDEVSGKVEGYEVSGGLFADMYNGRSMVPASSALRLGEDVAFVPDATLDLLESQVGGFRGAAQTAGGKLQDAAQTATEKVQDVAQTATEKAREARDQVTDTLQSEETHHKLHHAQGTLQEQTENIRQGSNELWENVKAKAVEYKDKAVAEVETQRIRHALGRPASRVVLDKNDNVILNVGDIITNEAVEKARAAGDLELLLRSVYDKEPELTTEDMKAKTPGSASK